MSLLLNLSLLLLVNCFFFFTISLTFYSSVSFTSIKVLSIIINILSVYRLTRLKGIVVKYIRQGLYVN